MAVLEVRAIYIERKSHADEINKVRQDNKIIQDKLDEQKYFIMASLKIQKEVAEIKAEPESLKRRSLILSNEILRFLTNRQANEPQLFRPETWQQDTNRMIKYSQQTMSLYSEKYALRVIAIRNEFADKGYQDSELDRSYEHPTNPIGIRIIAERIGALAEGINE